MPQTKQEINKRYYAKNKDKVDIMKKKWEDEHKEYISEIRKEHSRKQYQGKKNVKLLIELPFALLE